MDPRANDGTGERVRVVVADDAPDFRLLVRSTLALDGRFEVVGEAADGESAARMVALARPDVLLLDISMPAMDGLHALAELQAHGPDTAIVVMSGFDAAQVEEEAIGLGAAAYLEKGAALDHVVRVVLQAAGREHDDATGAVMAPAVPVPHRAIDVDGVLAYVTHELQNPVTVIAGLSATLRTAAGQLTPEVVVSCADAVHRSAAKLQVLVRAIGDARAIDAGRFAVETTPVDVGAVLRAASTALDDAAGGAELSVEVAAVDGVVAPLDIERAVQAVAALVENAALHGASDQPIEVVADATADAARITVRDHGAGFDPARAGELFQPFSRLGSKARGAGLGLYLVRAITRGHGGDAVAELAEGGGARFGLTFPLLS